MFGLSHIVAKALGLVARVYTPRHQVYGVSRGVPVPQRLQESLDTLQDTTTAVNGAAVYMAFDPPLHPRCRTCGWFVNKVTYVCARQDSHPGGVG